MTIAASRIPEATAAQAWNEATALVASNVGMALTVPHVPCVRAAT
jgi:hypothetical protein